MCLAISPYALTGFNKLHFVHLAAVTVGAEAGVVDAMGNACLLEHC